MSRPKRTKKDGNHPAIVAELRAAGFDVDDVADLPGLYDLVVSGYHHGGYVMAVRVEIKTEAGELNDTEQAYHAGQRWPEALIVARGAEDVIAWFQGDA